MGESGVVLEIAPAGTSNMNTTTSSTNPSLSAEHKLSPSIASTPVNGSASAEISASATARAGGPSAKLVTPHMNGTITVLRGDSRSSATYTTTTGTAVKNDLQANFASPVRRSTNNAQQASTVTASKPAPPSSFLSPPRCRKKASNSSAEVPMSGQSSTAVVTVDNNSNLSKDDASSNNADNTANRTLTSISCDTSKMDHTSPLKQPVPESSEKATASSSPPPSASKDGKIKGTSMKSPTPTSSNLQTLPPLDDKLMSPGGLFLSPQRGPLSFEEKKGGDSNDDDAKKKSQTLSPTVSGMQVSSDRYLATPTDFTTDYGKDNKVSSPFDTGNVLSWLQSPSTADLFSPGGLGAILNTPRAPGSTGATNTTTFANGRLTPRTPSVSTSFFFTDVAGLPRGETPKPNNNKRGNNKNSIICISPLASNKYRIVGCNTPMGAPLNFKDVFNSPKPNSKLKGLPLLNDGGSLLSATTTPQRSMSMPLASTSIEHQHAHRKVPSFDCVHLAERDSKEDEDLSVLLALANNTTPRPSPDATSSTTQAKDGKEFPALNLPMVGPDVNKNNKGDAPQLGMRSTSKSTFRGDNTKKSVDSNQQPGDCPNKRKKTSVQLATKENSVGNQNKKNVSNKSNGRVSTQYPAPQGLNYQDITNYGYPMTQMQPQQAGSLHVVIGVPPPQPPNTVSSSIKRSGSASSGPEAPLYPEYSTTSASSTAANGIHPYHGMYQYSAPPGMMAYPYGGQPYHPSVPPQHMAPYGSATATQRSSITKGQKKKSKTAASSKRPSAAMGAVDIKAALATQPGSQKKQRKSPAKKRKVTPAAQDRQKSAAAIQAVNARSGGKNDRAAQLAAAVLRGVTMRPSGKWQAQLYFAGKSRYIGVFDSREKAALAYEIAREKLKNGSHTNTSGEPMNSKMTENLVNAARKAAFEGVNEKGSNS